MATATKKTVKPKPVLMLDFIAFGFADARRRVEFIKAKKQLEEITNEKAQENNCPAI